MAKDGTEAETVNYGTKLSTGWTKVQNGTSIETASGHVVTVALVNTTKKNEAVSVGSATVIVGG